MASKILQQRQHSGVMDGRSPEAMRSCTRQHERWDAGAVNRWQNRWASSTARASSRRPAWQPNCRRCPADPQDAGLPMHTYES